MGQEQNDNNVNATTIEDFETWLATQSEAVRAAYETHVGALKKALRSERDARAKLEKQLKKIVKGEEVPDPVKRQIEALTKQLDITSKRAEFIAAAAKRGARYPDLLARAVDIEELDDTKIGDDAFWQSLREEYDALFSPATAVQSSGGDGGAGETPPPPPTSFDDVIRDLARR